MVGQRSDESTKSIREIYDIRYVDETEGRKGNSKGIPKNHKRRLNSQSVLDDEQWTASSLVGKEIYQTIETERR